MCEFKVQYVYSSVRITEDYFKFTAFAGFILQYFLFCGICQVFIITGLMTL